MTRRVQHWFVTVMMGIMVLGLLAGARATPTAAKAQQTSQATLVAIRAAYHPEATPKYDRVVFELQGTLPSDIRVEYVSQLIADGSGAVLPIKSQGILRVSLFPAVAHTAAGESTVSARISFNLPLVKEVVRSGDFEAMVSYGIGVSHKTEIRFLTLTSPTRVVIDFLSV